jgi:hypothetical protein
MFAAASCSALAPFLSVCGCSPNGGYSNEPLFPTQVQSVYVEMFDNRTFWRGIEYDLTDAVTKRIEAQSPYKVISSHDRADSVLSGKIVAIEQSVLSVERETGRALENEVVLRAVVNWKNLKTGQLLLDNNSLSAAGSFSRLQSQSFKYGSNIAANNLAGRIVELMEDQW